MSAMSLRHGSVHAVVLHALRTICAPRVVLGSFLVLSSLALGAYPSAAARPDFRFEPPSVILGLRGGWAFNRSSGEIYDQLTETHTLDDSDFDSSAFIGDVSLRVAEWLDVVIGVEFECSSNKSEYREFHESGAPIEQKTRLTQVPLTTSIKLYPLGRGRQVGEYAWIRSTLVPYLGGGIGGTWYELRQEGDFVVTDSGNPLFRNIFTDEVISDDWAFAQHAFIGFDLRLTRNFGLVFEGRYYWASADIGGDFVDFGPIDLDGVRVMVGFSWRL